MALPSTITATSEIFAQYQNIGPFIDGNNNLYTVLRNATNQNEIEAWKSSDGGDTWAEQDSSNRPVTNSTGTVTGIDVKQDGTMLYMACMDGDDDVYFHTFNTSDASRDADTWETVDKLVKAYTNTAFERSATIAIQSDGDIIIFSNGDDGTYYTGRECVEYHYSDDNGGTWTTDLPLGDTDSDNIVGPCVIGESDKIHVFWKEEANDDWIHNSLTDIDATPSADEAASGGITISGYNYTSARNAVYYDDGGVERVTFGFLSNGSDNDYPYSGMVEDDGTPDATADQISTSGVFRGSSNNHAAAFALCVDSASKTVWAVWADKTTQDVYVKKNVDDGGWTDETEIWDAVTCDLLSANLYQNGDSDIVIGYIIDDGGPAGTIKFNEYKVADADLNIDIGADEAAYQGTGVRILTP
jgi:hypothetical protein